jgi:hypothetical protein
MQLLSTMALNLRLFKVRLLAVSSWRQELNNLETEQT